MTTDCLCNKHLSQNLLNLAALASATGKSRNADVLTAASERITYFDDLKLNDLSPTAVKLIRHALDEFLRNGAAIPANSPHFADGTPRPEIVDAELLYAALCHDGIQLVTSGDVEAVADEILSEGLKAQAPVPDPEPQPIPETNSVPRTALGTTREMLAEGLAMALLEKSVGPNLTLESASKKIAEYREFLVTMAGTPPDINGTKDQKIAYLMNKLAPIKFGDIDKEIADFTARLDRILAKQYAAKAQAA